MDCIKNLVKPHVSQIIGSENDQAALAYKMFEIIEDYLEKIIDMDWCHCNHSKLAILGGIMLNCEESGTDRFVPLKFELRTKKEKTDIFVQTFGPRENENLNFIYENHD